MALQSYEENVQAKSQQSTPSLPSGIACTDFVVEDGVKTSQPCPGEMLIWEPKIQHDQSPGLSRASCSECGWRGWV